MEQEERDVLCTPLLTIGRTPPNDIVVPFPKVSRNHAMIRMLKEGEYYLIDVGSTNGTFLNGKRVVMPALLKDSDVIAIGECALTFRTICDLTGEPDLDDTCEISSTMTSIGVEMEEITLLVCDIRNYTPISETLPPNDLAELMAMWFRMATKVIECCSGTIDKFIGDAIMVRWASSPCQSAQASVMLALRAAKELSDICTDVNATFKNLPFPFRIGVGINTGRAVLGSVGGSGYREYTAIGDAVNMAFRFESESKILKKDVVVGPDSYALLEKSKWDQALQSVVVKGKAEPISVWAITFLELGALLSSGKA